MDNTDWTTTAQKNETTTQKKTLSGRKDRSKKKVEEYHVDPEKILKYTRGGGVKTKKVKDRKLKTNLKQREANYTQAVKQAAKSEYLLTEETGHLEVTGIEKTYNISQRCIRESVDITSAQKNFNLHLKEYGPYKINYTRNGKFLLLSGQKSHIASVNWNSKELGCEVQSQESNRDACWLHQDRFFAVAQKRYVHIYDHTGSEVHVLKEHRNVHRVHYLPYHFLLTTVGQNGHLQYQDTSTGKSVSRLRIPHGRCDCLTSNPYNGVVQLGHANGTVSMWAPTVKEPLVKMLCHKGPVLSIATEKQGVYMATTGQDGCMKVWDVRTYKPVYKYRVPGKAAHCLAISQKGLLAAAFGPKVYVFKDALHTKQGIPYMRYTVNGKADITDIEFCPYEDVLGVGHSDGFTSLIIPGAGEANFDALEVNPYESRKQKAETEVKMLLEKIQPELISLDPTEIRRIDRADAATKKKEKDANMEDEVFQPKYKKKGRSASGKVVQRKKGVDEQSKREQFKSKIMEQKKKEKEKEAKEPEMSLVDKVDISTAALDRFNKKKGTH